MYLDNTFDNTLYTNMYHCVPRILFIFLEHSGTDGACGRRKWDFFPPPFYLGYIAKMVPRAAGFIFSKRIYEVAHVLLSKATCYRQLLPR